MQKEHEWTSDDDFMQNMQCDTFYKDKASFWVLPKNKALLWKSENQMSPISVYFIFHQKVIFFIFFLFAYLQSYIHKSFTNCPVKPQHVLYANQPFFRKMIVSFFSSNIPLYVEKNPVEKPCKVLEMELKTYTPFSLKFVFEKIKFKVLHYIQHDFISQRLGFSKD